MKTLVYLHGFISSPASRKAVMLGEYLRRRAPAIDYRVPELHHRPATAIAQAQEACEVATGGSLLVVGSSLGGFFATIVAQSRGCRAVVINPAVHPHRHFGRYLGPQRNLYTGAAFDLTHEHVDELAAMDPAAITRPERYWLLAETGDEVLDYRDAVSFYAGARQDVRPGGDHSLQGFGGFMPAIVDWALAEPGAAHPGGAP